MWGCALFRITSASGVLESQAERVPQVWIPWVSAGDKGKLPRKGWSRGSAPGLAGGAIARAGQKQGARWGLSPGRGHARALPGR